MPFSYQEIIEHLELEPLEPEGGYFRRTYEKQSSSSNDLLSTGIYFLLTENTFSALHRLKHDELYHFYLGDPVELCELLPNRAVKKTILGKEILDNQQVQHLVPANTWQGSQLVEGGKWALLGTTMVPGFEWNDFELGKRDKLISKYPQNESIISSLTRS